MIPRLPNTHIRLLEVLGKETLPAHEIATRLYGKPGAHRAGVSHMLSSLCWSKHLVKIQVGMEYQYRKAKIQPSPQVQKDPSLRSET